MTAGSTRKVDGWRIVAYKDGQRVRLLSRNGVDHTKRFANIAAALTKLSARSLVLDGEVPIYQQQFRSRFEWLREPDPRRRRHAAAVHGDLFMTVTLAGRVLYALRR